MSRVLLEQVMKRYGGVTALQSLDLDIQEGEFLTLLGPSGCGKTTTLRLIAGFIMPTSGRIRLGDEDVTHVPPQHREIGMVFQDYALFPHMTIAENIAFGLVERGVSAAKARPRVDELLELIRLPAVGDRYPAEVSGGQQQRIAVARAVAYPPRVLLMDEPLGALDLKLRETMQIELRRIQQQLGITTVYVTHDQTEAMSMSDRIVVMNLGRIEQMGTAEEIYNRPDSRFVADFVGQVNMLEVTLAGEDGAFAVAEMNGTRLRLPHPPAAVVDGRVTLALRPELLRALTPDAGSEGLNSLRGRVLARHFAGNLMKLQVVIAGDHELVVEGRPQDQLPAPDTEVLLAWRPEDAIVLTR